MKKSTMALVALLVLLATGVAAQKEQTFNGEIMDSQCAMMGGHTNLRKEGETSRECTIRCVRSGSSRYVLYGAAGGSVYQIDDQGRPAQFAGSYVTVTGTYNAATNTIHVTGMLP